LRDAHHDEVAVVRLAVQLRRDEDFLRDALAVGHHHAETLLAVVAAHQLVGLAGQNLDDTPFAPAATVGVADLGQHRVAVEYRAHLAGTQVEVVTAVLGHHEAVAVLVALHHTFDQVHLVDEAVDATPIADQLAVTDHRAEAALQGVLGHGVE